MILDMMRNGGFGMYPTLLFGAALCALSVRFARTPDRRMAGLLVCLNWLTFSAGALGFVTGIAKMSFGLAAPDVDERGRIAFEGLRESASPLLLALILIVVSATAAAVGAWKLSERMPA
jgi:hypothetical protein